MHVDGELWTLEAEHEHAGHGLGAHPLEARQLRLYRLVPQRPAMAARFPFGFYLWGVGIFTPP